MRMLIIKCVVIVMIMYGKYLAMHHVHIYVWMMSLKGYIVIFWPIVSKKNATTVCQSGQWSQQTDHRIHENPVEYPPKNGLFPNMRQTLIWPYKKNPVLGSQYIHALLNERQLNSVMTCCRKMATIRSAHNGCVQITFTLDVLRYRTVTYWTLSDTDWSTETHSI